MKSEIATVWKCTSCDKEFKYESEKRRHEQSHVPQFECKVCSKKFSFVSALRRHEKQHERTESVQCSKCRGRFRDETLLKRHIQYAHKGTHKCNKCTATFNSELAVRTHMKTHKPESERKFRCSYEGCSKTFNFAHHLKHHELTHTDDKPNVCMECGKRFIQLHHLKIHQKVHKPDSWLMCTVLGCNKEFTNEYALRRHITTHKNKIAKKSSLDSAVNNKIPKTKKLKSTYSTQHSSEDTEDIIKEIKELSVSSTPDIKPEAAPYIVIENSYEIKKLPEEQDIKTQNTPTDGSFEEFVIRNISVDENVDIKVDMVDIDLSSSNCKSIVGKCIVTGDTETNENCLCAQITNEERKDKYYEVMPSNNNNNLVNLMDDLKCIEKRRKDLNACETCECANLCGIRYTKSSIVNETPEFESRDDNVIKIKGTFDIDFKNEINDYNEEVVEDKLNFKAKVRLMNSCKDILGNCIVSGDGTIGEGCLCARMTADDQQIIAQEIEDITPCPNSSWYKQEL